MNRGCKRVLLTALLVLAFMGSCGALVGPAARIADPMTRRPVGAWGGRFPVLVVESGEGTVHLLDAPYASPTLAAGQSFLVPAGAGPEIEDDLNRKRPPGSEGIWTLDVKSSTQGKQIVELVWIDDGYRGGVYEATARSVRPLYQKVTGPGFAFIAGGIALATNVVIWLILALVVRFVRKRARERPA